MQSWGLSPTQACLTSQIMGTLGSGAQSKSKGLGTKFKVNRMIFSLGPKVPFWHPRARKECLSWQVGIQFSVPLFSSGLEPTGWHLSPLMRSSFYGFKFEFVLELSCQIYLELMFLQVSSCLIHMVAHVYTLALCLFATSWCPEVLGLWQHRLLH